MSVAVCLIVAVPVGVFLAPSVAPAGAGGVSGVSPGLLTTVSASLKAQKVVGNHSADPFFAVVFTDVGTPLKSLLAMGAFLNQTPISVIRYGGGGYAYDPTTDTNYVPPPSGNGTFVPVKVQLWDLSWFKSWCYSRTPHCAWLGYLPAEENDTQAAVHTADWYHNVLGFVPTYWQFGNEPTAWTHYGKNVSKWATTDHSVPTGLDYATMVRNYVAAIHALFPGDRFVGIEAACDCKSVLVSDTAAMDRTSLSAMAYHSYPSQTGSTTSLAKFYGLLTSTANLTATVPAFRGSVTASCRPCGTMPLELGEYQAGPFYAFSPYSAAYPGAPFFAASVIQAIDANVSELTAFNSNSLYYTSNSTPSFEGMLYEKILRNLVMGSDTAVAVKASGTAGLFALLTQNGSHRSLLVVDANPTTALTLKIASTLFPTGGAGSYWQWSPTGSVPVGRTTSALPSTYSVAAQGILLLTV